MSVLTLPLERISATHLPTVARLMIFLGITSTMLCVPLLNKCYAIAIALFFLSGNWSKAWPTLIKDKVILTGLLLIILFGIGILYTQGSYHYGFRTWNKYIKLAYPLILIPLFTRKKDRNYALLFFLISVMISEIFCYLHYFKIFIFGIGPGKHWLFVQDLDGSFVVSFACYLLANIAVDNKKYRYLAILGVIITTFDILFLNPERAGYLIYLGLTALFLWQRLNWRGFLAACLAVPLLFCGLYTVSPKFNDRINQIVHNVSDYKKGNEVTSIGLRLAFAKYSFMVIKEHPLIGAGTGSFEELYRKLNGPKLEDNTWPAHPHNEYILVLFQIGMIGLAVILYWFYLLIRASFTLAQKEKWLLQGLILGFALLSFCNASLLVNPAGVTFITFISIFLASRYREQELLRDDV